MYHRRGRVGQSYWPGQGWVEVGLSQWANLDLEISCGQSDHVQGRGGGDLTCYIYALYLIAN